jgi:hypothetical protein
LTSVLRGREHFAGGRILKDDVTVVGFEMTGTSTR